MRVIRMLMIGALLATTALAQSNRFVIDDDEYVAKVTKAALALLQDGKLASVDSLRRQVQTKGFAVQSPPVSRQKLDTPDLCDRLRESTLAVGALYRCPDCGDWHFNSSAGFVVGDGGVVCTCCHVVVARDADVKEDYLIAADASGRVFPVRSVLAADTDADTCWLRLDSPKLKPLPLRTGVRAGERVFCLSHPGGYYFMFTQGLVARVNRRVNELLDDEGHPTDQVSRPILLLNVTAEFAPGSSGAAVVDEAGNVVGQVASITDAGEPDFGDENTPPSPSVPVRFCTASEEISRLADPQLKAESRNPAPRPKTHPPKQEKPPTKRLQNPP